ncbi:ectoine/hydroxyectoine ABC transporter substrate-binding protein EhuB [Caldalkalibacillus thermarum]|uniref:ectoine/hydroxyectoine ABC transporter substrate-binding protein EhuB n=1 Tax=Caldalkalibacillus thermarum TaxID=296745 RepID=UPI00166E3B4D|nr:ectoine/hydroxyectoine ABC transporter substrate-binding protein EhuB [Caldalkalibacillus thermarum]GGK20399.1 ectoine/hydroxyectoine ABC transporter substrate-binding protein EhuB [Caldalkalibacillus thermarum]
MRSLVKLSVLLLLVAFVGACGVNPEDIEAPEVNVNDTAGGKGSQVSTLERAQQEGVIRVGFANERPYAYATESGELTGLNVEIARRVFQELGIEEMEGSLSQFGSLIPGLQAGRFDVITAGMYITPERCQEVLFAEPEYSIGEALAVQAGNPHHLTSYEDIVANPDVKVGIMTGAIEHQYLVSMGINENQIHNVEDNPSAVEALKAGRVDAITMTGPSLREAMDMFGDDSVEIVEDFTQPVIDGESVSGYGSAAFRKGDEDFVQAYNEVLAQLKESGELLEIYKQFGFTEDELPGEMTTEQLCNR